VRTWNKDRREPSRQVLRPKVRRKLRKAPEIDRQQGRKVRRCQTRSGRPPPGVSGTGGCLGICAPSATVGGADLRRTLSNSSPQPGLLAPHESSQALKRSFSSPDMFGANPHRGEKPVSKSHQEPRRKRRCSKVRMYGCDLYLRTAAN